MLSNSMNYITVAAAILIGNLSIATAHGEHHQQQQQHDTVAVAHGSHNNNYQQHEPLGLGYRTRYNTLTASSPSAHDAIISTSHQLYLGPPPSSHATKTFEDSEFTTSSSSSSSHYHHHHSDNNINSSGSSSSISFAKSKAHQSHSQQSQQQQQSLVNINKHRIFTKSLRQTIGPLVNDGCDGASVIEPLALPYADQSTTEGATSDFSTDSCGVGGNTPGVWYSFTPNESGLYKAYVNSGLDLGIRIYSGDCSDGSPASLACVSQFNSLQTFIGVTGVNYKMLVSEGRDGGGGSGNNDDGGASFVFVLTNDDDTPFPSEAVPNLPSQSPVQTRPPRPPANLVTNAPIATRPPKPTTPSTTNAPVVQRPPKQTDKPVVVVEATPFPTASTPTTPDDNVGPAEINFIDLTTSISPNKEDVILLMEYEIGTNRNFETNLYQPDCITPLPSNIDITESPPTITPKDDGIYDEVTLIYTIDKASIGGNTLDLCVVFSLKDSEGVSTIMEEKRQVKLELSSEEVTITGAPGVVAAPTPPPVPVMTTTNQPTKKPTPPVPGMSCQVCSTGLTVPSFTPVGAGSKVCADLLVDAAAVLEGSSQCNAMAAAIPTCCPPTPPPVPVTNKPTSKPTSVQSRPPSGSISKPPSSYGWGGSGWQGGGSSAHKPPPPPPSSPSGWGGSGWQTNPAPTKPSWQSSKKPSPSPTIKCTPQPSSSNNWHGYSGGSDGWLFGSKSSKSRYDKCHNGWYSSKSSKSSKSKGKSSKNGSWGGNGWYSGNQLDRIKVESNDAWHGGRSSWYIDGGVVVILSNCLISLLGAWM